MTEEVQTAIDDTEQVGIASDNIKKESTEQIEQPEPRPQWDSETVEDAKLFGWKAPDEWQGEKPEGYIDNPEEFLDRVQRSRIFKTMQDKLERAETNHQDQARRLEAMNAKALELQKSQYQSQLDAIVKAQRTAVEEGDTDRWDALERQRGDLMKQAPQEQHVQQQNAGPDPYVSGYVNSENGAWLRNPILYSTAVELINKNPVVMAQGAQQQIEYAEAEVRKMYPAYFPQHDKPKMPAKTVVDGGGLAGGAAKINGAFAKLPADAKQQFQRFVKQGLFEDTKEGREEYANEYNAA